MMSFQERLLLIFLAILPVFIVACINFILFISSSSTTLEWLTVNTTASAPSVRIGRTPWTEAPTHGTAWWLKSSSYRPKSRYVLSFKYSWIVELPWLWLNRALCLVTKIVFLHVWHCIHKLTCTARDKGKNHLKKRRKKKKKHQLCQIQKEIACSSSGLSLTGHTEELEVLSKTWVTFSFRGQIYFSFFKELIIIGSWSGWHHPRGCLIFLNILGACWNLLELFLACD